MIKSFLSCMVSTLLFVGCAQTDNKAKPAANTAETAESPKAKNKTQEMSCKLTTPEMQQRKETVLASLKKQMVEKKELPNGFAYKFAGTDTVLDELTAFIKSERGCCSFFTFNLSVSGDQTEAWLELTGDEGVKKIIVDELGL